MHTTQSASAVSGVCASVQGIRMSIPDTTSGVHAAEPFDIELIDVAKLATSSVRISTAASERSVPMDDDRALARR